MKTILNSRRDRYLAKFSIFLITVALIVGMVGCTDPGPGGNLEIYDWSDLDLVRKYKYLDGHHTLMNNLDAGTDGYAELAGSAAHGGKGWEPIDNFHGSFDGQDHTIMGLFIDRTSESDVGFFGSIDEGGVIKNVNLVNVTVTGSDNVGGLVGENSGTVSNSFSSGSVTGDDYVGGLVGRNEGDVSDDSHYTGSVTGDVSIGGLVGRNEGNVSDSYSKGSVSGNVSDSYSTVSVSGNENVGGLVGWNYEGNVSDSYSEGNVNGDVGVGGLVGKNEKGNVSDSHSKGSVTGTTEYIGGLVGWNYDFATVSNSYSTGSVTGDKYVGGLVGGSYKEGTVRNSYSTGSVTGDVAVGGLVGYSYKSFVRNSHYNYDEVLINGENIITIGALFNEDNEDFDRWLANGKFLDVNKRLSKEDGYYVVNNVSDFKQLLAFGQDGSLKFRLKTDLDLATEPNFYIPYLAGEFDGNCLDGNGPKISNLSFNFDFVYYVGLFGYLAPSGTVTQVCVENVKITGACFVGGLVGANFEGSVRDSYSTGDISDINGDWHVGGLVGLNYEESTVESCYSTCSVTGNGHVGGLVGDNQDTVSNSHSTGSVIGSSQVGGLVGDNSGTVSNSYSIGIVIGDDDVGGLVGFNDGGTVKYSCSTGNVRGDNHVGGLVGRNKNEKGMVSNSYSTGNVRGDNWIGGLVGFNEDDGTVNTTYSTGYVRGDNHVGGLVGENKGDVSRSFWDTETSEQDESYGGIGETTEKMQDITTFTGAWWSIGKVNPNEPPNLNKTWNIVEGEYPFLSQTPVS